MLFLGEVFVYCYGTLWDESAEFVQSLSEGEEEILEIRNKNNGIPDVQSLILPISTLYS